MPLQSLLEIPGQDFDVIVAKDDQFPSRMRQRTVVGFGQTHRVLHPNDLYRLFPERPPETLRHPGEFLIISTTNDRQDHFMPPELEC